MLKLISAVALAASLSAGAAQAQAPTADGDTYRVAVRTGDLNLSAPSGLATFRGRVRAGAAATCGSAMVAPLAETMLAAQCRARFSRTAEARLSLVLGRSGNSIAGTR